MTVIMMWLKTMMTVVMMMKMLESIQLLMMVRTMVMFMITAINQYDDD